jgi:hypothetical protein
MPARYNRSTLLKFAIGTAVFVVATEVFNRLLSEALVQYEMWATHAASRTELSDDYRMRLIGILIIYPLSAGLAAGVAAITVGIPWLHRVRRQ